MHRYSESDIAWFWDRWILYCLSAVLSVSEYQNVSITESHSLTEIHEFASSLAMLLWKLFLKIIIWRSDM